jgi:tripartite-type tricarboxylate transporter receptor subunit TctC
VQRKSDHSRAAMRFPRRQFLLLAAGTLALPAIPRIARAQTYPTRPVRIVVGFAPGGPGDITARLEGQWLAGRLGRPFIVENKPGAAGNIATEAVVHSAPDGYTLFLVNPANAISASLYENLNFDFLRDIAPIANIIRTPNVLEVNSSVPVNNVSEFIAYAKAHPGKINFGSGGIGTLTHVAGELFKMMTGVDIVHISYRGTGPAVTALLAGEVQVMFDALPSSIEHIKSSKFRALGVTSATRSELLPDVPTVGDSVPGYEASGWYGLGGPRNLPREVVDLLNKAVNSGSTDRTLKSQFADLGGVMLSESPADFAKLITEETEKWSKVIREANIRLG